MTDPGTQLAAAREAVLLAAVVCRRVQAQLDRVRAVTKDDKSPVTVADFASQAIVAHVLQQRLGPITLVGEESAGYLRDPAHAGHLAATLDAVRSAWPNAAEADVLAAIDSGGAEPADATFWTLDPIDGTKGFLRNQQYAVALALIDRGRPVLGALACPNLPLAHDAPVDTPDPEGSLYLAQLGAGVSESACVPGAHAHRLAARDAHAWGPVRITASVETAHTNVTDEDRLLHRIRDAGSVIADPVRMDSQAKYAVVARGQADAYLRLPTKPGYVERIWDHAAGSIVATEAGAIVTDITGQPLDFSRGRGLEANRGVVCASSRTHQHLIDGIRALAIGSPART